MYANTRSRYEDHMTEWRVTKQWHHNTNQTHKTVNSAVEAGETIIIKTR